MEAPRNRPVAASHGPAIFALPHSAAILLLEATTSATGHRAGSILQGHLVYGARAVRQRGCAYQTCSLRQVTLRSAVTAVVLARSRGTVMACQAARKSLTPTE